MILTHYLITFSNQKIILKFNKKR